LATKIYYHYESIEGRIISGEILILAEGIPYFFNRVQQRKTGGEKKRGAGFSIFFSPELPDPKAADRGCLGSLLLGALSKFIQNSDERRRNGDL
jgi:hypothetical protein